MNDKNRMGDEMDRGVGLICIISGLILSAYTTRDFVATAGIFLAFFTGYGYIYNGSRS